MKSTLLGLSCLALGVAGSGAFVQSLSQTSDQGRRPQGRVAIPGGPGQVAFHPIRDAKVDKSDPVSVRRHIAYLKSLEVDADGDGMTDDNPTEGESKAEWFEAYYAFMSQRLDENGKFNPSAYLRAGQAHVANMQEPIGPQTLAGVATQLGPVNIANPNYSVYVGNGPVSGRKNDIAVYPGNANTIYVASAGGGVWKTTNGGTDWAPLSDAWPTMLTSSVAVHPTNANLVMVGTGDNEGFFGHYGNGIMRSTDGGSNWNVVGTNEMRDACISKIFFDPADGTKVLALTNKGTAAAGGVYRSTDSGATWAPVTGLAASMQWTDIDRTVNGVYLLSGVKSDGSSKGVLYKSTNAGSTWTTVTNPSTANNNEIDIACSKAVNNVFYMLSIGDERIYKSTNAGTSWTNIKGNFVNGIPTTSGLENLNWGQKDYDFHITTGKNGTQDVVYVGLIGLMMDVGGDGTWADIGRSFTEAAPNYIHADQHCGAMHPTDGTTMFFGGDGGIFKFKLTNATTPTFNWSSLNAKITDHQAYHVSVHPTDTNNVMVGMQDNATAASRTDLTAWKALWSGDGSWSAFDRATPAIHYASSQNGGVYRHATATTIDPLVITPVVSNEFAFIAPLVTAGPAGSTLFLGGTKLWKYNHASSTWSNSIPLGASMPATELAVAPSNANIMYSGNPEGIIIRTGDGGVNWTQVDDASLARPIGALAVSFSNPNVVVCGVLGGAADTKLYRCTNTTAAVPTWTNISGSGINGLPKVPVGAVAIDPHNSNIIYAGTDIGGFMTTDGGVNWTKLSAYGLPNVAITHMQINLQKNHLYIATFGRGVWRLPLANATTYSVTGNIKQGTTNVPGVDVSLQQYRETVGTFIASPNIAIPDNNATGISLGRAVTTARVMTRIAVYLNITHPNRGDLQIDLRGPDGTERRVISSSTDTTDNYLGLFEVPGFEGKNSSGTWTLKVKDVRATNAGRVVQWKVQPYYMAYGTVSIATTDGSGNYTFTAKPAGKYLVIPSQTGRTFTPANLQFGIGPNATGKNFQRNP